jgi:hypothetical protein
MDRTALSEFEVRNGEEVRGVRVDESFPFGQSEGRCLQQLRMGDVNLPPFQLICFLEACFCLAQDAGGESIRK